MREKNTTTAKPVAAPHSVGVVEYWNQQHHHYALTDWIAKPSIFAHFAFDYFPRKSSILDLGAGQGQDSRFFAQRGHSVTMLDISNEALELARKKLSKGVQERVTIVQHDMTQPLPSPDASFDVVFSHMSLHYFDEKTTAQIFSDIHRVLTPQGIVAILVNSTEDPQYKTGELISPDYYKIGSVNKRFFTTETLEKFVGRFETLVLDNKGESYKDQAADTHNLIRYIGRKRT